MVIANPTLFAYYVNEQIQPGVLFERELRSIPLEPDPGKFGIFEEFIRLRAPVG
jgi:hypothetical protein